MKAVRPGLRRGRPEAAINPLELLTWWEGRGGCRALSLKEIGRKLGVAESTVRKRLQALRAAGDVDDEARTQARGDRRQRQGGRTATPIADTTLSVPAPEVPVNKPDAFKVDPAFDTVAAAKILGVKPGTMEVWRYKGLGPRFIKCGSRVVYRLRDINEYLDHRTRKSTADPGSAA